MTQKHCLIIVAILMWVALLSLWVYYTTTHKVVCSIEQGWDCPENVQKCYKEIEDWYPTACPAKQWVCEPLEVEVCR